MSSCNFDDLDFSIDSWSSLERVWDDEIAAEAEDHIVPDPCQTAGSTLVSDWRITSKLLQRSNVRHLKSGGGSGYGLGGVASPWVTHSLQRGSTGGGAVVSQSDANVLFYTGVDSSRDDRGKPGGSGMGGNSVMGNVGNTGASELLASSTRESWDDVPDFQLETMSARAQSPMGQCDGTTVSDALRATDANGEQEEEDVRKYVRDDVSEGEDTAATDAVQSGEDGPPMSDMEMAGLGMGSDMEDGTLWEYALGSMNDITHLTEMENILLPGFSTGEYGGKSSSLPFWLQSSPVADEHGGLYAAMVCGGNGPPGKASGPKIGKDKFCELGTGSHGGGTYEGCSCGHKECKCAGKTMYALMEHDQDSWIGDDEGLELRGEPGAGVVLNEEPDTIMSGQDDAVSGQCKDGGADGRRVQSQDQSTSEVAVGDDSEVVLNGVESPMVPTLDSDFPSPFLYFYPKPLRLCEDAKQTSAMVIRSSSGERGAPASVKAEKSFHRHKEGGFDGGGGVSATTGMTSRGAGCDNSGEITSQCSSPMEASSCVSPTSSMSASVDGGKGHRARRTASARKKTEEKARRQSLQKPGLRSMGTMTLPMDSYQLSTQTVPSLLSRPHIMSSRAVTSACATSAGNLVFSDVQYIPQQQPQARLMGAYPHNMYISPLQVPLPATGVPFFPHQEAPALHQDQLKTEDRQHNQHLMFGMADMSCQGSYQYTQPLHHSHLASGTAAGSQASSQRILAAGSKGLQLQGPRQLVPSAVSMPHLGQGPVGGRHPIAVPMTHSQRVRYLQFRRLTQMHINQQVEPHQPDFQPQQKTLQRIQDCQGQDRYILEKSKPSGGVPGSGVVLKVEEKAAVTPPDGADKFGAVAREKEPVLYPILEIPLDDVSVEAVVLRQLESAIRKLDIGTCDVIRDALYRLAESAAQRAGGMARMADASANASLAGLSGGDNNRISSSIAGSTLGSTAVLSRSMNSESTSLDTNLIDRKIAELLFHAPARMTTSPQGQISVATPSPIMQTLNSAGHISTLAPNLGFTMPPSSSFPGSYYFLSTPSIDSHMYPASSIGHVMSAPQPWMWQQPHIAAESWLPSSALLGSTTAVTMGLGQGSGSSEMMAHMTVVAGPLESPIGTLTGKHRNMAARNLKGMAVSDIGSPRRLGGEKNYKVPPASMGIGTPTGTGRAIGMRMGIDTGIRMAIEMGPSPAPATGPILEASQMGMGLTSMSGGATGVTTAGTSRTTEHMRVLTVRMDTEGEILSSSHGNHEGASAGNTAAMPMGEPGNQGFSSEEGQEVAVKLNPTDQADVRSGRKHADMEGLSCGKDDSRGGSGENNVEGVDVMATEEDSERGWEWEWEGASGIEIDCDGDRRGGTPAGSLQGGEQGGGEHVSGVDGNERREPKMEYNCRAMLPAQPPQKQRRVDIGIQTAEGVVGTVGVGGGGCRKVLSEPGGGMAGLAGVLGEQMLASQQGIQQGKRIDKVSTS